MASIYGSRADEKVKLCELNLRRCTLHWGRNPANLLFLAFSKQRKTVSKEKGSKGFAHQSFDQKTALVMPLIIISISRPRKFHWKMSWRFKNYERPNPSKIFILEKCFQTFYVLNFDLKMASLSLPISTYPCMCRFFFKATNNKGNTEHAKNQILEQRNKSKLIFFLFEFWGGNVVFCNIKVDVCFIFFFQPTFLASVRFDYRTIPATLNEICIGKVIFIFQLLTFFLEQFSYI